MILVDILKRKRKLEPLLKKCWQRISENILYPAVVDEEPAQKLIYYGLLSYATIYESAIVVGMSPSTAHYLARMQLGKYKLGEAVTEAVESTFSGFDTEAAQAYADLFHQQIGQAVQKIVAGENDVDQLMQVLAAGYQPVRFK